MLNERYKLAHFAGILSRLRRDRGGNVLAIMAASLIPLLGFSGSAVDMARLYLVKSRLQQACDAGTLAGRRAMTDTSLANTALDATAKAQADGFFFNNFPTGSYGTTNLVFTPRKASAGGSASANAVSADASATVPMVVMKVFGIKTSQVAVACQARFDVADTDVLFVLDTTGSMACLPTDNDTACNNYAGNNSNKQTYTRPSTSNGVAGYAGTTAFLTNEKDGSRIDALRTAVLSFYDTFAANADPTTKVRYGFVTYTSSVNMGRAILDVTPASLVGRQNGDTATYQSRQATADYTNGNNDSYEANGKSQSACTGSTRTPATPLTYASSTGNAKLVSNVWSDNKCYTRTQTLLPRWEYRQFPFDVTGVVAGNVVTNPTKVRGQTMRWLGCVETTVDNPGQTTFTTTSPPSELDPDVVPSGANRWIPHMQDLVYQRNNSATNRATDYSDGDDWTRNPGYGFDAFGTNNGNEMSQAGSVACGKPVKRLGAMTRDEVRAYVEATDFVPMGGTYHDVGMIWGARLISPTGLWAADTAAWPGRNAPNRVIVFLTDGDMSPSFGSYGLYGIEGYDRRVGNGTTSTTTLTDLHNRRFLAACAAARARNIDIWTVAIDSSASTQLQSCATTTAQALFTTNGAGLSAAFTSIARRLALLRVSQ